MSVVIITGASRGIGAAILEEILPLLPEEVRFITTGRSIAPHASPKVSTVVGDICDQEHRNQIVAAVGEDKVLYLIHNSGVAPNTPFLEATEEQYRSTMELNVFSGLFLTQQLAREGKFSQNTRILNIASGAGVNAHATGSAYCLSKAAMIMLGKIYKAELTEPKVYCASCNPGLTDTSMPREFFNPDHPILNLCHTTDAVAKFIKWLLVDVAAEEYEQKDYWDLYDQELQPKWMPAGMDPIPELSQRMKNK